MAQERECDAETRGVHGLKLFPFQRWGPALSNDINMKTAGGQERVPGRIDERELNRAAMLRGFAGDVGCDEQRQMTGIREVRFYKRWSLKAVYRSNLGVEQLRFILCADPNHQALPPALRRQLLYHARCQSGSSVELR
jgi:hypothetical protein